MKKEKTWKEKETENTRGRKRYIERIIEDKEAQDRLEEFLDNKEEHDNENSTIVRPFS